ncbi:class I SAM-dependent methyltransferase [Nostoc commune]|uniref:class I SAM-dependent methyltransferase n=1 Tax=Nostoc commune TaxID=1178 RepID=UPI0018C59258|nr:class I SAM-dependent methyltransferase [Nostoc commune]MBG1259148.1 class I SAM-dependent methyltransferase [Nostoc commune BAE]
MSNIESKLKVVEQGWKKLKKLSTIPLDLKRVALIRGKNLEYLSDAGNVESLMLYLGLNDEGLEEFPESIHQYCGQGLRIWQYPIQFSKYLIDLGKLKIDSYLEIGIRHGGTFVATVEYLEKFSPLKSAIGIDIIPCPSLLEYKQIQPNAEFVQINTQSKEYQEWLKKHERFDLVLIDSFHEETQCRNEFLSVKDKANIVAFHDIANIKYPGVRKVWDEVKNTNEFECREYIDQYENIDLSYMGIGLAVRKERL